MKGFKKLGGMATLLAVFSIAACKKDSKVATAPAQNQVTAAASKSNLVLFPGAGWVPASQVHLIEPGSYIKRDGGHIYKMESGTNRLVRDFGKFYEPAKDASQQASFASRFNSLNSFTPTGGNPNWITWGYDDLDGQGQVTNFSTTWTVPNVPTADGQAIFVYSALTDPTQTDILQPVLQYGNSSALGGGSGWSVTNVYFMPPTIQGDSGFYAYSTPVPVSHNQSVTGVMSLTAKEMDNSSDYSCSFTGLGSALILKEGVTPLASNADQKKNHHHAPFIPALDYAHQVIEAYSKSGGAPTVITDYPSDNFVAMKGISITLNYNTTPALSWQVDNQVTTFGAHTSIISNSNPGGEVDLYFHNPVAQPAISYPTPNTFYVGIPITALTPTNTGGAPISYSISPALSAGLTFNTTTGVISGTPTAAKAQTTYTVTATNWGGTATASVVITVVQDVNFGITNNSGNGLSITFYRTDQTQNNISVVANAHSGTNPPLPVPPGVYTIRWNPSGTPVNCVVTLSNGQSSPNAPGGQFTGVAVNTSGGVTSLSAH